METLKKELCNCTKKNTPSFSFDGKEYLCKCISVYDGDTITIAFKPFTNEPVYKYNIRLSGVDTPEIRTSNPDEKKKAIEVRDALREKILDKFIYIKCCKFDKYGRLLAEIFDEYKKESMNAWLIKNKYAYKYDGGTKQKYSD